MHHDRQSGTIYILHIINAIYNGITLSQHQRAVPTFCYLCIYKSCHSQASCHQHEIVHQQYINTLSLLSYLAAGDCAQHVTAKVEYQVGQL